MGDRRPNRWWGVLAGVAGVAVTTAIVFPLKQIAPVAALIVVYLVAVLIVSVGWGAVLGVCTALAGALAFNFFHLPPTGRFTIADAQNWVALAVFFVVAVVASSLAEVARRRTLEAEQRRREADLAAELARLLLRGEDLATVLPTAAQRLAQALSVPSAAIELRPVEGDERRVAFPLREGAGQIGTLLLPADLPEAALRRAQERVVPPLEALLGAAMERDELLGDVVETRALRRSDVIKTALLRAVSHDLRTPITAIVTAAEPLASTHVDDDERRELARGIQEEARRLARLIENLLDLSRLEAHAADPRPEWCPLEEVLEAAIDGLGLPEGTFAVSIQGELPMLRADAAQLERAFANLLENAEPPLGRPPGLDPCARGRGSGSSCASSTAARGSRPRSASGCSSRSTGRGPSGPGIEARGSASPSRAGSSRPTAGRSRSSRSPARARRSRSTSPTAPVAPAAAPAAG